MVFPGSNCDNDCRDALFKIDGYNVSFLWHKENKLPSNTDLIVLPGGFSYGDYLRAGAIAAMSPIMTAVKEFFTKGGYILGICNGFQILTETQILPGALIPNINQRFICKDEEIIPINTDSVFTSLYKNSSNIKIPIAHHDGQFYINRDGLKNLVQNNCIAFKYKNNPNGSIDNIAGIFSKNKRVLGLMPHPERATDNQIGSTSGLNLFQSILENI